MQTSNNENVEIVLCILLSQVILDDLDISGASYELPEAAKHSLLLPLDYLKVIGTGRQAWVFRKADGEHVVEPFQQLKDIVLSVYYEVRRVLQLLALLFVLTHHRSFPLSVRSQFLFERHVAFINQKILLLRLCRVNGHINLL